MQIERSLFFIVNYVLIQMVMRKLISHARIFTNPFPSIGRILLNAMMSRLLSSSLLFFFIATIYFLMSWFNSNSNEHNLMTSLLPSHLWYAVSMMPELHPIELPLTTCWNFPLICRVHAMKINYWWHSLDNDTRHSLSFLSGSYAKFHHIIFHLSQVNIIMFCFT